MNGFSDLVWETSHCSRFFMRTGGVMKTHHTVIQLDSDFDTPAE